MSTTIASRSARVQKSVCGKCQRTIYITVIAGERIACDPELMSVVPFEGAPAKILARRIHGEMCLRYQSDAERKKALASARRKAPPAPPKPDDAR